MSLLCPPSLPPDMVRHGCTKMYAYMSQIRDRVSSSCILFAGLFPTDYHQFKHFCISRGHFQVLHLLVEFLFNWLSEKKKQAQRFSSHNFLNLLRNSLFLHFSWRSEIAFLHIASAHTSFVPPFSRTMDFVKIPAHGNGGSFNTFRNSHRSSSPIPQKEWLRERFMR